MIITDEHRANRAKWYAALREPGRKQTVGKLWIREDLIDESTGIAFLKANAAWESRVRFSL